MIYQFVFFVPQRWDRRHSWSCKYYETGKQQEDLPWNYSKENHAKYCRCAEPPGIGLLKVNSQVYHEAAPIFYQENIFCFTNANDVVEYFEVLPSKYHTLIQYISVLFFKPDSQNYFNPAVRERHANMFWSAIRGCPNLKTFDISSAVLEQCDDDLRFIETMRNLRRLSRCSIWIIKKAKAVALKPHPDLEEIHLGVALNYLPDIHGLNKISKCSLEDVAIGWEWQAYRLIDSVRKDSPDQFTTELCPISVSLRENRTAKVTAWGLPTPAAEKRRQSLFCF